MSDWLSSAKRLAVNLGLLVVTGVATLLVAELVVRWLLPQQLILKRPDIWKPAEVLGWTHYPNVNTTVNTGERTVHFRTDQDGDRVAQTGRKEGDYRILLIGDSFMEALQVEYEQSLAGLLESRLPALLEGSVAVRNSAVGGWDPDQYFLFARDELAREHFDLVLVSLFMENDIIDIRRERVPMRPPSQVHPLRFPRRLGWNELVDAVLYPINDFLEVRSQVFILVKTRLQTLLMRLGLTEAAFSPVYLRSDTASPRWELTARICEEIAGLAKARNTPILFMTIPASYQVDTAIFRQYIEGFRLDPKQIDLDQPDRIMGERLRRAGLTVIDVLPVLREAFAKGMRPYGYVDRHFSPEGHRIATTLIEQPVADAIKAPRSGPRRRG